MKYLKKKSAMISDKTQMTFDDKRDIGNDNGKNRAKFWNADAP